MARAPRWTRGVLVAADERAMRKAELISAGYVFVDPGVELPPGTSHSTAGPDAGERAVVFAFEGLRVRMRLSDDPAEEFRLVAGAQGLASLRGEAADGRGV